MTDLRHCTECGAAVAATAPMGLCPQCLVRLGLAAGTPEPASPADEVPDKPPSSLSAVPPGPTRFGDYQLLEEIGRGGMGVVYRAHQPSLERQVALKMILFGPLASAEQIRRFRTEASAAAALQHPNIVAVHEVGVHEGQHYLAMDLVDGPNLAGLVKDKPLPAKRAASYLKAVAEAIHFAHEHGILHRDLKPSNVLVGSDDRPRVADFGLARRLGVDSSLTISGQMLGSPNYMPPEQAAAGRGKVGRAGDVYGLGAVLYHLLTARPPFQAETIPQTIQLVTGAEPLSPRALVPSVPRDLETICLKCLEKDPAKRYPTAQALAEELDRFVKGEPIFARPVGPAGKAWRWCRRKPAVSGLAAALIMVVVCAFIGVLTLWRRAEVNRLDALRNAYAADMKLAGRYVETGNWGGARALLGRHEAGTGRSDLRGWEWRYLWRASASEEAATLGQHPASVSAVAFSPDGPLMASGGREGVMRLWDWRKEEQVGLLHHGASNAVTALGFSPDGRLLAVQGIYSSGLWDVKNRRQLRALPPALNYLATGLAFSPDGHLLAVSAGDRKSILLWDVDADAEHARLAGWTQVAALAFSPDGRLLASGGWAGGSDLWDVATNRRLRRLGDPNQTVNALRFSPDGSLLAVGDWDGCVRLYETTRWEVLAALTNHSSWITSVRFAADGQTLFTASGDQSIKVWEIPSGRLLSTLKGHRDEVYAMDLSADGTMLATGCRDGAVKLWRTVLNPQAPEVLRRTNSLARRWADAWTVPSVDRRFLLFVRTNGWVTVRAAPNLQPVVEFHTAGARSGLALSERAGLIAVLTAGGEIDLLDWKTGAVRMQLPKPASTVVGAEFAPNGQTLILVSEGDSIEEARVEVWDVPTLGRLGEFRTPCVPWFWVVDFSPDSQILAVGGEDGRVHLWHLRSQRKAAWLSFGEYSGGIAAVRFSPDGRTLAIAQVAGVTLWDLQSLRQVKWLGAETRATCFSITFSPDGRRLIAGGGLPPRIMMWDLSTERELLMLSGHSDTINSTFFADEDTFVSISGKKLIVWQAASLKEIEGAARRR